MEKERWHRLMNFLDEALSLNPKDREAFVEQVCTDDMELKKALQKLITASDEADSNDYFEGLAREINPLHEGGDTDLSGMVLGSYQIERRIGRGGMGLVYLAEDIHLKRAVALKFLPSSLQLNSEARQRFVIEARAAASLQHPNICTVYNIVDTEEHVFIAMAYVDGESLKERIQSGPLDVSEALRLSVQICEGLRAAHDAGIVHRDIKPANLMVNTRGRLIIMDFGLAKVAGMDELSKSGTTRGTVAYMSPEQVRGEKVDRRSDLWSLGIVLYEMLTGTRPFSGKADHEVIYNIMQGEPVRLSALRPDIPSDLEDVLNTLLDKNRDKRFQSAQEIAHVLRALDSSFRLGHKREQRNQGVPSVAVLPFINLSDTSEHDYFGEGLAEEIINSLSQIPSLHVAARVSSFSFKNTDLAVQEIGKRLQVDLLLKGSIRKEGNRVRIVAQLIQADNGYHVWSQRYDRVLEDVFQVQDELTANILEALKIELLGKYKARPGNLAYTLYLKSRYYWNKRTGPDLEQALQYARKAIDINADYAAAHACMADAFVLLGLYGFKPGIEVYPEAYKASQKAIQLDPSLAEAYTSLGASRMFCEWDWYGAERACRQALALNPSYPTWHSFFAVYVLAARGRMEEAINEIEIAQYNDPLSYIIQAAAGIIYWQNRQFEVAFGTAERMIEVDASYWLAHALQGMVLEQTGRFEEAIQSLEKADMLSNVRNFSLVKGMLGHAYGMANNTSKAYDVLERLNEHGKDYYVSPFDRAVIYAGLKDDDNTFLWLERAVEERSSWIVFLNVDPRFEVLKREERFIRMLEKMGLIM